MSPLPIPAPSHRRPRVRVLLGVMTIALLWLVPGAGHADPGDIAVTPEASPEASAQAAPDSPAPAHARDERGWGPVPPKPKNQDWIQLDSREWLKGEIVRLYNDRLEFDSDKLDDLTFDWEDVTQLVTAKTYTVRFVGRVIVLGRIDMKGDRLVIWSGDVRREFKREDLVSIVPGSGRELDYWSLKLSLGMTGQSGNTNQLSVNATFDLRRETALTRWTLDYNGNVALQDEARSANNHRIATEFDYYFNRRVYLVVPTIEFFQDEFQNIEVRATPSVGIGYEIVDRSWVRWEMTASIGYQGTRYLSVEPGEDDTENDVAVPLSTTLNFDFANLFELENSYQVQVVPTDMGKTNHHLKTTLSVDIWGPIDLNTTFQLNRIEKPRADEDGVVPKQNDYLISVGFELEL